MPYQEPGTVKPKTERESDECVLVIGDETGEAAGILDKLGSASDERVRIERVSELSSGIDRLRGGGVGAVVLDLTFPDTGGMGSLDKLFQAAPGVPILIV